MRIAAATLLVFLSLALGGCANCFIDAMPVAGDPGVAFDCDPAVGR